MVDLKPLEATPSDAASTTRVYWLAFTDILAQKLYPHTSAVFDYLTGKNLKAANGPSRNLLKVVAVDIENQPDPDCDPIVANAIWIPPKPAEGLGQGPVNPSMLDLPPECDREFNEGYFGVLAAKWDLHMGEGRYWCTLMAEYVRWGMASTRLIGCDFLVLSMLGREPDYHGHGAASQLIRYGLDPADEDGLEAYVESTPSALSVYEHFGWINMDEVVVLHGTYTTESHRGWPGSCGGT